MENSEWINPTVNTILLNIFIEHMKSDNMEWKKKQPVGSRVTRRVANGGGYKHGLICRSHNAPVFYFYSPAADSLLVSSKLHALFIG